MQLKHLGLLAAIVAVLYVINNSMDTREGYYPWWRRRLPWWRRRWGRHWWYGPYYWRYSYYPYYSYY